MTAALEGIGPGTITGFVRVDSYRYGRRQLIVVRSDDGRRFEIAASELRHTALARRLDGTA